MKFEALSESSVKDREKQISDYWKEIDLLKQSTETRKDGPSYVFFDGPPTANGKPGIHHVISRTLKDMTCRYKTMRGYYVERKAGWDTHGLPVEIEAEKKLHLNSKKEIEEYGVEKFNKVCRESVFTYSGMWKDMSDRMAFLADMDNPYITLDNDYIETAWHLLDDFNKKGLLYEGAKILPYCPRCGTGLASHEVAQGYKIIKSQTATVKFKLKDKENEYFLAWTTTPWTLPSNVALTVGPEIDYVKVKKGDEYYYLAEKLATKVLGEDYEVVENLRGKDMEYMEYEQLLPYINVNKKAFFVTLADYVSIEDGTGIVHSAPAFGEDDYQVGLKYNLPLVNPVDEEGKFKETPWKGKFVMDCDLDIVIYLGENNKLFSKQKMEHNYPHCWRCGTPLIYYSKPSWYLRVTDVKDKMVENNKGVNWFPAFTGEKRFGNWLENLKDWAISRSRYWGTPLPVWKNEAGDIMTVGSRKELAEKAIEDVNIETLDMHRPFVDNIHLRGEDGSVYTRVPDVMDVWFDSGAMPFAQNHYPFENTDKFENLFPADFISEGIDQTRGWFYTLMAISTMYKGVAPYKNVLVNDLVLDKEGKKMSKSRGNTLDVFEMFDKHGADAIRFYSIYVSPAWVPTKFDEDGVREVEAKLFRTLRNTYSFFQLYAQTDKVDPTSFFVDYKDRPEIDRWLISKYHSLIKYYDREMDVFEYTNVARKVLDFLVEDLSNWYIRRNRRRFWKSEINDDKKSVYNTTYEVLVGLTKLLAPMIPFTSEELYRKLVGEKSVHLEKLPQLDESLIDEKLEEKMDIARRIVTLGRSSREDAAIKVRQPLSEILLDKKYKNDLETLVSLIKEELNVKEVVFSDHIQEFMNFELKPNFKIAGAILGKYVGQFGQVLKNADARELVEKLEEGSLMMDINGEEFEIKKEYVDIRISSKEGFDIKMDKNLFVILDTELTPELLKEGYMREFISKVQQMRKSNGYEVMDSIEIFYEADDELSSVLESFGSEIMKETLAVKLEKIELFEDEIPLNDKVVKLKLNKK
ncbi:isoleucine--tRNA ligase [Helcococcus ovis]|uniref:Isoleucine--tRNA ligase n=1 Tax=Helcococcus ovis TaxID=72026 RepID=A0A4R9C3B9_9FIRM|nr:isoleucine--tRNA ligase [Helcococcus ovis]TFF64825.1 isoleucine--tRNA ligase [Helcococcus ovis]TFF65855.1 isoleucine--tRNA ligase [Helcococcus ovis]TFF67809.1 isoleucine--tRNA ligase [Helcococcus ovis]WNZ01073.1 isoleucine--tRNA ligase [Helcococcus ovis]